MRLPNPIVIEQIDSRELADTIVARVVDHLRPLLLAETPLLVTAERLAELLSLSRATIDRLRASGKIPSVGVGTARRYEPIAVLRALQEQSIDSADADVVDDQTDAEE